MRHIMLHLLAVFLILCSVGHVEAQAKPEKLYTVNFENKSWDKVIDWLEKESGLMCITKEKPTGSITLKSKKEYKLGEVIDLFNERLEQNNLLIHRQSNTFALVPADQKIAVERFAYLSHDELKARGKTEPVLCWIQLKDIEAGEVIAQVKKTLSPLGEVELVGNKQLTVRDNAAYVRNVIAILGDNFNSVIGPSPMPFEVIPPSVLTVDCQVVSRCDTVTSSQTRFHLFPLRKCR